MVYTVFCCFVAQRLESGCRQTQKLQIYDVPSCKVMSDCVAKIRHGYHLAQDEKEPDCVLLLRSGSAFLLGFPFPFSAFLP